MFNIGGFFLNGTNCNSILFFTFTFSIISIIKGKRSPNLRLTFVCFQKVGLPYRREGTRSRAAGVGAA
jgi:hypothetical protein